MVESTTAGAFALSKIYYGIAGLFGGFGLSFFWMPQKLKEHSRLMAGCIIGGLSVGSSVIFGGALAVYLGMNPEDANTALAVGGGIGLMALAVFGMIANTLKKYESKDAFEIVAEIKGKAPTSTPKPAAKRPARKTVKKAAK